LKALFLKDQPSKVYLMSLLKDPTTFLKFGYLWTFFQPDKDAYARTILPLKERTEELVVEFLREN
jgi:hypothetical protein